MTRISKRGPDGRILDTACGPILSLEEAQALFQRRVEGCGNHWLWTGSLRVKGYGLWDWPASWVRNRCYGITKHAVSAHRASFRLYNDMRPIPTGLAILHFCDIPMCVNPDCLSLGTNSENVQQMYDKGRGWNKTRQYA